MKTNSNNKTNLPGPFRFTMYVLTVSVFCFLNWAALKAGDRVLAHDEATHAILGDLLGEASDEEIRIAEWMLGFDASRLASLEEPELENRMSDYPAFSNPNPEDEEPELRDWMVDVSSWEQVTLIAGI